MRLFRDRLKQQEKILKQEVGMLPKSQRKPVMKQRQENFEKYQIDKVLFWLIYKLINLGVRIYYTIRAKSWKLLTKSSGSPPWKTLFVRKAIFGAKASIRKRFGNC